MFRSVTGGLFVIYAFANRVARSGEEAVSNTTFYIYRKVGGQNFPSDTSEDRAEDGFFMVLVDFCSLFFIFTDRRTGARRLPGCCHKTAPSIYIGRLEAGIFHRTAIFLNYLSSRRLAGQGRDGIT